MSFRLLAHKPVDTHYLDMSVTNVNTSGWAELASAIVGGACAAEIFNPSSSPMLIAVGSSGNEVALPYTILPGGSSLLIPINLSDGDRLTLQAIGADVTTGVFIINLFG